jgi:asparagine synthase (glutamine-hydrolysing)
LPAERSVPQRDDIRVALGHRRLSIVDLSPGGYQPMATAERDLWVVYNGEIYNHVELREELRALGHAFRSQSDTEVLLAAYRAWGRDCLARFNGMFAFVLVDRNRRTLFAARDRFGVKPLYWWADPRAGLALASEIKQLGALPEWRARLNGQRAYDFLVWGLFDHTSETLFREVNQLAGGECLEVDLHRAGAAPKPERWYALRPRPFSGGIDRAAEEFGDLLRDSVRLRLRADVPVGSCLSGGLDSSSIVCAANAVLRAQGAESQQRTFSACMDVPRLDERRYVDAVVRATRVEAHFVSPQLEPLFDALDRMIWHQDEPFGSTSIYAQWEVFRLAAQHGVKVMLDGQGADESLGGYPVFFSSRIAAQLRSLDVAGALREAAALRRVHGYPWRWTLRQALIASLPAGLIQALRRTAAPDWLDANALGARAAHPLDPVDAGARASLESLSEAQLLRSSLPALLHWEDRDSMAHSVEARVPFLDYRLVEFALGLPPEHKISGAVTKRVLREAMKGVLPEAVRARTDKLGFQTPEEEWMRGTPEPFRAALARAQEACLGILRPAARSVLEEVVAGGSANSSLAWRLIAFGAWIERFRIGFA